MGAGLPGLLAGFSEMPADDHHSEAPGRPAQNGHGDELRAAELMELVYDELRAIAAEQLRHERVGHTLQPTALVHEAYLRLAKLDRINWQDRTHFHVTAAAVIRRVLVDHARARLTSKRGGGSERITLSEHNTPIVDPNAVIDVLALDEAMKKLHALAERKCRVVELRYFGGLTIQETAAALGVGTTTVEDDWAFARAWLRRELGDGGAA